MKHLSLYISIFFIFFVGGIVRAQSVVFASNFDDASLWVKASAVATTKTLSTSYGTVEYLDLAFYPTTTKTYNSVAKTGYIDFAAGSSTISTSNAYIKLPPLTFSNGGTLTIVYGSGSTGKKLQLQEWTGSSWSNGSYAAVTNPKSSVWYTYSWTISGSGSKIFRLVLASSTHMYVPEIVVTSNQPTISVNKDTINFGSKRLSQTFSTNTVDVTPNSLASEIVVNTNDPFKINTASSGTFYSSATLPSTGGTIYAKFAPTTVGTYLDSVVFSSSNANDVKVYLKGVALPLSSADSILSFSVNGYTDSINQATKTITLYVPSSVSLPLTATPIVTLSEGATLVTSGSLSFNTDSVTYVSVEAEDGSLRTYSVVISKVTTGIKEKSTSALHVYSIRDKIVIDSPSEYEYIIYDIAGNFIEKGKTITGKKYVEINKGMYVVIINNKSYKMLIP